jgi:hypothetical protein
VITSSTAADLMLNGQAIAAEIRVTMVPGGVTWDFEMTASDVSIDASMTTDLPAQSRMQVGYPLW